MPSSLQVTDEESAAVQKTPNRVTLAHLESLIDKTQFINPDLIPHMTICVMVTTSGYAVIGKSAPADPNNFDPKLGMKFAYEDAMRQMWPLEGYALTKQLAS